MVKSVVTMAAVSSDMEVLTADLHAAQGRVWGLLVAFGEGRRPRAAAHGFSLYYNTIPTQHMHFIYNL